MLRLLESKSMSYLRLTKVFGQLSVLAPMIALTTSILQLEAKAVALIENALISSIGCSSTLILGTTRDVTSNIVVGYVFTTDSRAYSLDSVTIPLANGFFGGSFIGDPTTAVVSLYKVNSDNQLIGGPTATSSRSFRLTGAEECKASQIDLAGFQVAPKEKYFLGIGSTDSIKWSLWDNDSLITTNGGVSIPGIGVDSLGRQHGMWYIAASGRLQETPYYGNIRLLGSPIQPTPAPIPALGLTTLLVYSRKLRLRIKASRS